MTPPLPAGSSAGATWLRRFALPALAWTAATATATSIAWFGVGLVTTEVTDAHPVLSTARVAELASAAGPDEDAPEPAAAAAPAPPAPPPTTSTTTTAQPAAPPTTVAERRVQAPPASAPSAMSTFDVPGGVVAVRCSDDAIRLVSARPVDGFRLVVRDDGPLHVVVDVVAPDRTRSTWAFRCSGGAARRFRLDTGDRRTFDGRRSPDGSDRYRR